MPTYLYETLPAQPGVPGERFEVRQGFSDPPLTAHPESGVPVHRVISGGLGLMRRRERSLPEAGPGCGPANCLCGRFG
jgi:hypothetical protein